VGFDVLTTCQPSTVWCSLERLPAAAAQPAKARQSRSATDYYYYYECKTVKVLNSLLEQAATCFITLGF
jgi:hypothetical protein